MFTVETVIHSIIQNGSNTQDFVFNLIVPPQEEQQFINRLSKTFNNCNFTINIKPFEAPIDLIKYVKARYTSRHDARYMNYARFFLPSLFPRLKKVLYLDTDLIVLGNLNDLFETNTFTKDQYYAAVPHTFWAPLYFKNPLKHRKLAKIIQKPFNGGVFLTDLSYWDDTITQRFFYYCTLNKQYKFKLFSLSTEPLQNLIFHNFKPLERRWNRCGFGNSKFISHWLKVPDNEISILHWSGGIRKPWTHRNIAYKALWDKYQLQTLVKI